MVLILKRQKNKTGESRRGKSPKTALLLILSILAVVLVSGCIANFPGAQRASIMNPTVTSETQDLILKAEAVPLEVRSGKRLDLYFELDALKDLRNLSFNITDSCLFSGDLGGFENLELKANRSKDLKLSLIAGIVSFDTDCQVRFKSSFNSTFVAAQDIIVLSESEYLNEQRTGKINERFARFASTDNPLQIIFSFSNTQPFENDTEEFMYMQYYAGSGLEKLSKNSVQFTSPNNVKIACDDYTAEGNRFTLNRDLVFIDGMAKKSTCKFATSAQQDVDSKTLQLTANYLYAIDNFINVKIKPK